MDLYAYTFAFSKNVLQLQIDEAAVAISIGVNPDWIRLYTYVHCGTINVVHIHWAITIQTLSRIVVFLFHSFMDPTVETFSAVALRFFTCLY